MDYIIYTTDGFTQNRLGEDVENCQIIDFVDDTQLSKIECIKQYQKMGNDITGDIRINDDIHKSILKMLSFLKNEESVMLNDDFEAHFKKLVKFFNV